MRAARAPMQLRDCVTVWKTVKCSDNDSGTGQTGNIENGRQKNRADRQTGTAPDRLGMVSDHSLFQACHACLTPSDGGQDRGRMTVTIFLQGDSPMTVVMCVLSYVNPSIIQPPNEYVII